MRTNRFRFVTPIVLLSVAVAAQAAEAKDPFRRLRGGEQLKRAVVVVEAGGRTGLGFLIDPAGLVVTDYRLTRASELISVVVPSGARYRAVALGADKPSGIAVIRVHPSVVKDTPPLPLWNPDSEKAAGHLRKGDSAWVVIDPAADDGIAAVAVIGIVLGHTLVCYGGFLPESALGGPLLSTEGEVVAVNSSRRARYGRRGRGSTCASGIDRVSAMLERARDRAAKADPPSAASLVVSSPSVYPEKLAAEAAGAIQDTDLYRIDTKKVRVEFLTPPLIQREARSGNEIYEPYRDFYNIGGYRDLHRPVVIVQGLPELRVTAGSGFRQVGFGIGQTVAVAVWIVALPIMIFSDAGPVPPPIFPPPRSSYRFKRDLRWMALLRDGVEVQPLESELRCKPKKMYMALTAKDKPKRRKLRGCHAFQAYPPETFRPGAKLSVRLFKDKKKTKAIEVPLGPEQQARIWDDFRPWFKAVREFEAVKAADPSPAPDVLVQDFTSEHASFEAAD